MNRFGVDGSVSKARFGENHLTGENSQNLTTATMESTSVSAITQILSTATSALLDNEIPNVDEGIDEYSR